MLLQEKSLEVEALFDKTADVYGVVGPEFFTFFGRKLVEISGVKTSQKVLDIACGRGAVLLPAAQMTGEQGSVVGIDISQSMIELTAQDVHRRNLNNVCLKKMDAQDLQFGKDVFDTVLSGFGLFFCPQPQNVIESIFRVLKPGGTLGFSTWARDEARRKWIGEGIRKLPGNLTVESACRLLPKGLDTAAEIENIIKPLGFSEICINTVEFECLYDSKEQWWEAQWTHGIRSVLEYVKAQTGQDGLEAFKVHAFDNLQNCRADGKFSVVMRAIMTTAKKP